MASSDPNPGERILWTSRASLWSIALRPLGVLVAVLLVLLLAWPSVSGILAASWLTWLVRITMVVMAATLIWSSLWWAAETFTLTDQRLIWDSGVLRRLHVEVPLKRVQSSVRRRNIRERLFGLGTLAFSTAGTDIYEIVWSMISRPQEVQDRVREAIEGPRKEREMARWLEHGEASETGGVVGSVGQRVRVIGLAGGVGAGKSEVARLLGDLGCVVLDSDHQAKALLDEPGVRDELVRWWGQRVLLPAEGDAPPRANRKVIAGIIFGDPAERSRLEQLIHPRLKAMRRREIERLSRSLPRPVAIIIDAPLLFEAGVDSECDGVIFVDAPREQRLARVKAGRGWDEAELDRREAAQLPVEEKRRRSTVVVNNEGDLGDLEQRVREAAGSLRLSV